MAQAAVMTKPDLLAAIKAQLPTLATQKASKGWDIVLDTWDDDTIVKAMGRSSKLPGAIWAIEWRLTELVAMRNEAQAEDAETAENENGASDADVNVNDEELAAAD